MEIIHENLMRMITRNEPKKVKQQQELNRKHKKKRLDMKEN